MSTSPILAAVADPASFQSSASTSLRAPVVNPDFHQVLQQLRPAVASNIARAAKFGSDEPHAGASFAETVASIRSLPDAATAGSKAAAARNLSALASPGTKGNAPADPNKTNLLASLIANCQHPGTGTIFLGLKTKKESNASNSVSGNASQLAKQGSATRNQKQERTGAKSGAALSIVALPTPTESSMSPIPPSSSTDQSKIPVDQPTVSASVATNAADTNHRSVATALVEVIGRTATTALSAKGVASSTNSAAFSPAASVDRDAATTAELSATDSSEHPMVEFAISLPELPLHAAFSNTVASVSPMVSTKPKAKPQAVTSSGKAEGVTGPATGTGNNAASESKTTESRAPRRNSISDPATAENALENDPPTDHSVLRTGTDPAFSQIRSGLAQSQAASQRSSAVRDTPPTNNSASASSTHDAGLGIASAISAHMTGFQLAAVSPPHEAATPALDPDATASGAQSMPVSAIFAQPSQHSAAASAPPEPRMPANTVPTAPLSADSGQLRVTAAGSELKISVQLPELGRVEVRAVTAHDVTTAHLTAFRHEALPVLAAERAGLEQALKSKDVILGSLNSHTQDSHSHGRSSEEQRQPGFPSATSFRGASSIATTVTASATKEAGNAGFLPDYSSISVRA